MYKIYHTFDILTLVFQHNRHDMKFVTKFRKISKRCKEISEYWLTELTDIWYIINIDFTRFKNLRKLTCPNGITDKELQQLPHLTYLDTYYNREITDEGIKHLKLETLIISTFNANHCAKITNEGIKNMPLKHLDISCNPTITNAGIKHFNLNILSISYISTITDEAIKNMNLTELDTIMNDKISNEGIAHMTNLLAVHAYGNNKITKEGIKNSPKCILYK